MFSFFHLSEGPTIKCLIHESDQIIVFVHKESHGKFLLTSTSTAKAVLYECGLGKSHK